MTENTVGGDTELFNELQGMRPYKSSKFLTDLERFFQRLSHRAMLAGLAGFGVIALLWAARFFAGPLPPWLKTAGLMLGLLDIIAWYVMLLSEAAATFVQVANRKVRDHHDRRSFAHDLELAIHIRQFPPASIARADAWLEQEGGGMERRVSVLFGKEIAMVTILTTLLTGKANELGAAVVTSLAPMFHTTSEMVVGALCTAFALLLIGAFRVKARVARFAYLRYLIRIAGFDNAPESEHGASSRAARNPPVSPTEVVALSHRRRDGQPDH